MHFCLRIHNLWSLLMITLIEPNSMAAQSVNLPTMLHATVLVSSPNQGNTLKHHPKGNIIATQSDNSPQQCDDQYNVSIP
ncbi:exported hypothetical protein [Acidithiobacillus ferrivorans]|uniref:Uncharacterized protein n=1 Tax=Acidithiobacillus ferrivorans TaxID=160808 RepID=A0A060V0S0_9PROT|nr:exported hypothetical protein [Acidithiobacillus ferrivorans]